jgi:hypothetical protein
LQLIIDTIKVLVTGAYFHYQRGGPRWSCQFPSPHTKRLLYCYGEARELYSAP